MQKVSVRILFERATDGFFAFFCGVCGNNHLGMRGIVSENVGFDGRFHSEIVSVGADCEKYCIKFTESGNNLPVQSRQLFVGRKAVFFNAKWQKSVRFFGRKMPEKSVKTAVKIFKKNAKSSEK